MKKSAKYLLFCIANSNLFRIFVVQTNKVTTMNNGLFQKIYFVLFDLNSVWSIQKKCGNGFLTVYTCEGRNEAGYREAKQWIKNNLKN